jgi:hypothetical protein
MAQSVALPGRIGIVPSDVTDPVRLQTWVSDAAGFDTHSRSDEYGRTYAWRFAGRWAGLLQAGAQRLPDIGGQRGIPSSRDALPRGMIRPARQLRLFTCRRAASIDRRPSVRPAAHRWP